MRRQLAALAVFLLGAGLGSAPAYAYPGGASGGAAARPMVRAWWPDAGAGRTTDGLKLVDQQVRQMADGGFGGMEVAFLSDQLGAVPQSSILPAAQRLGRPGVDQSMAQTAAGTCCLDFSNAQAQSVGYGTENWQRILTQIYRSAKQVPGGFVVDLTLSQHWPLAYNNVDPNDPGQNQYARTAYSAITAADLAAGHKAVPQPAQRLWDLDNVPFVFADRYQAATVVKVASVAADGTPTFAYSSLTDTSSRTSRVHDGGSPAGIMDAAWTQTHPSSFTATTTAGSTTLPDVTDLGGAQRQAGSLLTGPGIAAGTEIVSVGTNSVVIDRPATATGAAVALEARWNINTIDADWGPASARPRMNDRQNHYTTALDRSTLSKLGCAVPAAGAALTAGDCVLFGTWNEGTGQTRSGGVNTVVPNREYVTSVYDAEGTQATIDFWENNILGTWRNGSVVKRLGDTALLDLVRDSARRFPQSSVFEDSLEFSKPTGGGNYWAPDMLADMSGRLNYDAATYAPVLAGGVTFDTSTAAGLQPSARVTEDWTSVLGDDFSVKHVDALQKWAKRTLGYNFRVQDIGGTGVAHAQLGAGVHETSADSGAAENGRQTAAAAALTGSNWVTAESLTFTKDYTNPWADVVEGLNEVWAAGINRPQWHGTPFPVTFNGQNSAWPGWEFQHGSPVGWGAFAPRQTYWGNVNELTGYVTRMQSVLQSGKARADLAVLRGSDQFASPSETAYSLPTLLDHGWNYQVIDDRMVQLPSAVVRGGVLAPDGPAYRGVVVNQVSELKVATVTKLTAYARAGLPIVLAGSDISRVYGTQQPGNTDRELAAAVATLKATPHVYIVAGTDQNAILVALASAGVTPDASYSAPGLITLERVSGSSRSYYLFNSGTTAITDDVTLTGTGRPTRLDAWTGRSIPAGQYNIRDATVTTPVALAPHEATVITVGGGAGVHATTAPGGTVRATAGGGLVLRTGTAGTYTVALSNGRTRTITVPAVPAAPVLSSGWNLSLQSWGPDGKITTGFDGLGSWSSLPATADQLSRLGVTSMAQISGIGTYRTTTHLPATWRSGIDGATLTFAHGNGDEVVAATVNGHRIIVDQVTDTVDAGPYLQPGDNTVTVEVDSNLGNRVGRAAQTYGLSAVVVTPYTEAVVPT